MNLSDIRTLREVMNKYGISAQKKYGQNFLADEGILETIVEGAGISSDDTVLEIGPGLGTLTAKLAAAARKVVAVEIDAALIPVLKATLADFDNVEVISADILKCDIRELYEKYGTGSGIKVAANLPYYITTPIVLKLLEYSDIIESITVMVQKEVAQRMQAAPGSKDYGALSLAIQYYSDPRVIAEVPSDRFYPSPAVDSAVIVLESREHPPVEVHDVDYMFRLIRATFNMRRKTLPNALSAGMPELSRDSVEKALDAMDLPHTVRGETFSLEDFARLAELLHEKA